MIDSVPAGLFVPGILCGASYGRLVGYAMTEFHGGKDIDEGTYALLGAASFLGGEALHMARDHRCNKI